MLIIFSSTFSSYIQFSYGAYAKAPLSPYGPTVNDDNLTVEKITEGLDFPTSMSFIGNNDILVTEKEYRYCKEGAKWSSTGNTGTRRVRSQ